MCKSAIYLGAPTPFGVIIDIEPRLYNPQCRVRDDQGSETVRPLARLIALGVKPPTSVHEGRR